jgi:hypothetical protein
MQIHIHPVVHEAMPPAVQAAVLEATRVEEHRRGEHPWGSMRRDCPLCVRGVA